MSSANVVSLHGQPVENDRRRQFAESATASFDAYVESFGVEPEAMVWVFGGLKQSARSGWLVTGDSEGGPTTMVALAAAVLTTNMFDE
jgi:hypothetical protein